MFTWLGTWGDRIHRWTPSQITSGRLQPIATLQTSWRSPPSRGWPKVLAGALRYGVLLHFGSDAVTTDLPAWFASYNGRQLIEAGIEEGKGVFQMHHLKVRQAPALWLQEQFAAFAANLVRWAAHWFSTQCYREPAQWLHPVAASVKTLVRVAAHTPACVEWLPDGCLLRFTACHSSKVAVVSRFTRIRLRLHNRYANLLILP